MLTAYKFYFFDVKCYSTNLYFVWDSSDVILYFDMPIVVGKSLAQGHNNDSCFHGNDVGYQGAGE